MSTDPAPPDQPVPPVVGAVVEPLAEVPPAPPVAVAGIAPETAPVAAPAPAPAVAPAPGHHAPLHTHCENCGTRLEGPFCHRCGQHDFDFKQGFGHALHDALENFFHFDTKLFRNIVTLLFRPGLLSAEFNAGHRAAQMPPLRLYIFISILFFFVSFTGDRIPKDMIISDRTPAEEEAAARKSLKQTLADAKRNSPPTKAEKIQEVLDSVAAREAGLADSKAAKVREPRSELEKDLEEKGEYAYRHQHELAEAFVHAIPKMLLFCLPLFALYTRVLFRKAGLAYLQHLVIAVHYHTFIFLWLLFRDGWVGLARLASPALGGWLAFAAGVWLVVYPVLMTRRLFGHAYRRTLPRTAALALAYNATLALAFAITALVVLAMI